MLDTMTIPEDYPALLSARAVPGAAALGVDLLRAADSQLPEHSETGPSQAGRLFHCPGSLRVGRWLREQGQQADDSEATDDSQRGDRLHAVVARCLNTGDAPPADLDDDDAEAVVCYLDHCHDVTVGYDSRALWLVEERVDLRDCGAGWGTVDMAIMVPGRAGHLIDAKFGARAVPHPRHNWQTILYGHGLCRAFGLQQITLCICRPAADVEWRWMEWTATADELARLARAYAQQVAAAERPDAPLVVGDHCQATFCAARSVCPARWACAAMVPRHGDWRTWLATVDACARRDAYERAKIAAQQFGAFAAAVEDAAVADPVGMAVDGYSVQASRGRRAFMDPAKAESVLEGLARERGKDPECIWTPRELITPAQAEKLLGKSAPVVARMEPLIHTLPGKPALKKGA